MRLARALLFLALCLSLPVLSHAQCPGMTTQQMPFDSEPLTISNVAKGLTQAVYKPAGVTPSMALLTIEGGPIRYAVIGTPTSSSGHPLGSSQTMTLCGLDSIAGFKAISITSDVSLTITYYKSKQP